MTNTFELALIAAREITTSPERLRELSEWTQPEDCCRLRHIIAANPNADMGLLDSLAPEHPLEVLNNKALTLLDLEEHSIWNKFSLKSLIAMLVAIGDRAPGYLVTATRSQLSQALEDAQTFVDVTARECWSYSREVVINPEDVDGLLPEAIMLSASQSSKMTGEHQIYLECEGLMDKPSHEPLARFLQLISYGAIEDLVYSPFNSGGDDFTMSDSEYDEEIFSCESDWLGIVENCVILKRDSSFLFNLRLSWCEGCDDDPVDYQDGMLTIPIGSASFSSEAGGYSLEPSDLGSLGTLLSWSPPVLSSDLRSMTWPHWLARSLSLSK
jgi:hypothetical protein